MKKIILIAAISLAILSSALAQDNTTNSASLVLTTNTITTVRVSPLKLTGQQMDEIIQQVQGAGIQADAVINSTNIQSISVVRTGANLFTVQINLRHTTN